MSASIAISLSQPIDGNRSSRPEQLTAPGGNFDLPHINQNGSYAFDEVIKRGVLKLRVRKRGAWKGTWKTAYTILRPNVLSIYNDEDEAILRTSINLSDVTAAARIRSPRSKRTHVFGVFTSSKNHRFQASSDAEAAAWIEVIQRESHADELDRDLVVGIYSHSDANDHHEGHTTAAESISDFSGNESYHPSRVNVSRNTPYADVANFSELSDSFPDCASRLHSFSSSTPPAASGPTTSSTKPDSRHVGSSHGQSDPDLISERIVCQGYLKCLRSKGAVKQWKRLWGVLRARSLVFYKTDQEYSAVMIIAMPTVINAAEIDPISKSKSFCLQIIAEDKTYRFCAPSEQALAAWLGALKSVLNRN